MISLILTILYLAKDTLHRWCSRVSSPIARVLVVFFLTLSALSALGSYVITVNIVRHELISRGADTVVTSLISRDASPLFVPSETDTERMLNAESYELQPIGMASLPTGSPVQVYTFAFRRQRQLMPLMAPGGTPTLLQPANAPIMPPGPGEVTIQKMRVPIMVRNLPDGHTLLRIINTAGGALIVAPDRLPPRLRERKSNNVHTLIFRAHELQSSESILRIERFIRLLQRYEKAYGSIISVAPLLRRMDDALKKQALCRVALCLGISAIVGILLTALAGMEYRQNEYIYTLMKSFGIHPMLLVGAFIMENLLIVSASFLAAIATFMYFQHIIITQVLRLGNYSLTLSEIMPEIRLIAYTLLGCVLISTLPILVAANREIGRVLK